MTPRGHCEARSAGAMAGVRDLLRLALPAVRRASDDPAVAVDDGVAAAPELGRDAGVRLAPGSTHAFMISHIRRIRLSFGSDSIAAVCAASSTRMPWRS